MVGSVSSFFVSSCIQPVYSRAWPCFANILSSLLIKKIKKDFTYLFVNLIILQLLEDMKGLLQAAEEKRQASIAELCAKHQKVNLHADKYGSFVDHEDCSCFSLSGYFCCYKIFP